MPTREEMWNQIPVEVDVAVIGGGITGAGIARDAARRVSGAASAGDRGNSRYLGAHLGCRYAASAT